MRCIGRTRSVRRCGNSARFLLCHHHRYQPLFALLGVAGLFGLPAGIYQDAWKLFFPKEQPAAQTYESNTTMSSTGDSSPVVKAGRDAIVNITTPKADYVTDHDGAGALLMTEPDFRAFVSSSIGSEGKKVIGRLVNGTEVAKIELKTADPNELSPPWAKVKVLEGELKDSIGWILMNSLRKP